MIEEIIPGNKTKLRIVRTIYENPGINLTSLIRKVKLSPNFVLMYVNKLSSFGLIKENQVKRKKKVHVRNLKFNFKNLLTKFICSVVELDKKLLFFKKYKKLNSYFLQLNELFNKKIEFAVIYGSYFRLSVDKDSDLDLLIVGSPDKEMLKRIKEIFVTLDSEVSIKIESTSKFLSNIDKPLYQNILKEHVIVYGEMDYAKILSKIKVEI